MYERSHYYFDGDFWHDFYPLLQQLLVLLEQNIVCVMCIRFALLLLLWLLFHFFYMKRVERRI